MSRVDTRPPETDEGRSTRRRNLTILAIVVAVAVAAVAVVITVSLARPGQGGPVEFRPLAGAGSDTTDDVMTALSDDIREIASYEPGPSGTIVTKDRDVNGDCTLPNPSTDALGVAALAEQQEAATRSGAAPCLDFARSTADTSATSGLAGLTYVPFAVDAVTFAQRADSPNPRALTTEQLRQVYTCAEPTRSGYLPLLPTPGSGLRAVFLGSIGLSDTADFTRVNTCVSEVDRDRLVENFGPALTDPRHIAPYSVAQHVAGSSGTSADENGLAVLGQVDGVSPTRASPGAVGVAYRQDSLNLRSLTAERLRSIYTCSAPAEAQARFVPLLPGPGSPVRTAFLQAIGLTDGPDYTATNRCVSDTDATGQPNPENTGTLLTDPRHIAPYSVEQYLAQVNRTVEDVHGNTVLGTIDGVAPTVLNTDFPFTHDVYNVIPTARLAEAPTAPVFVGPESAICRNTATITRHGFARAPNCGDTSIRTPR